MAKNKKKKFIFVKFLLFIFLIFGITFLYGIYIEPNNIIVNEYQIKNKNITDNFNGFKIVHVGDIDYGDNFGKKDLKKLVNKINDFKPNIVVFTGNLIDKNTKITTDIENKISSLLGKIDSINGKYIVNGSYDYKFDQWENIVNSSGFTNLNNSYDTIYNKGYNYMVIGGVSSFADKEDINSKNNKTNEFINSKEKNGSIYNILLLNEADYIDKLENNKYNLILASHLFEYGINSSIIEASLNNHKHKYTYGYYKIDNNDLYVTNGVGNVDYKFRLFNTPSFNVYVLKKY